MDLWYYYKYDKKIGFKVAIDGFHNMDKNSFYIGIYCYFPPGTLYTENIANL